MSRRKRVVIYGNCHTGIIKAMLRVCDDFNSEYEIIDTKMIQDIRNPEYLKSDIFSSCDVFIHQSIRLGNRYGEAYASENIISRLNPDCRIISIPNVYHLPLCFFPQYSEAHELKKNGITYFFRDKVVDSHIDDFLKLPQNIIKDYNNVGLYDSKKINDDFENFILKVRKREIDWDIKVSEFILTNYRDYQLFYDPNHPTNYFFEFVVNELLKILFNDPNRPKEKFNVSVCLDAIEIPVCQAVKSSLKLRWSENEIRKSNPWTKCIIGKMNLYKYSLQYYAYSWMVPEDFYEIRYHSRVLFWGMQIIFIPYRFLSKIVKKAYKILAK